MTLKKLLLLTPLMFAPVLLTAQGKGIAPAELLKPLSNSWPTYNGDYSAQALQHADADQPAHREEPDAGLGRQADRRVAGRRRRQVRRWRRPGRIRRRRWPHRRGRGHGRLPDQHRCHDQGVRADGGRDDLHHRTRQRLGARRARWARALALLLEDARGHAHRDARVRDVERLPLHGNARQLPGVARGEDRQGALAQGHRRLHRAVFLDHGADRRRQSRHRGDRKRSRHARLPAVVRRGERRPPMEAVYRSDEPGRSGSGHVAEPRRCEARRRAAVAAGRVRSRHEALHLRNRQPDACLYGRPRRRRQPVYGIARRGQRRYREDGVALPDRAARHARLGFRADARDRRRRCSKAGCGSS